MDKPEHALRLIQLAEKDLSVRERLHREKKLTGGYHPEMEKVHRDNAAELRSIIHEIGFPGISKVGQKASEAAWLIAQHAISEPEWMKSFFELMTEYQWDVDKKLWAYLYDRIQFFQGKPQGFGTQLNADGSIYPVLDPEQLNFRRQKYGLSVLSPIEMNGIAKIEEIGRIENENPDYVKWRSRVGWK